MRLLLTQFKPGELHYLILIESILMALQSLFERILVFILLLHKDFVQVLAYLFIQLAQRSRLQLKLRSHLFHLVPYRITDKAIIGE